VTRHAAAVNILDPDRQLLQSGHRRGGLQAVRVGHRHSLAARGRPRRGLSRGDRLPRRADPRIRRLAPAIGDVAALLALVEAMSE
jgi:hypothetical protein